MAEIQVEVRGLRLEAKREVEWEDNSASRTHDSSNLRPLASHLKPPEARREVEVKVKVEWEDNSGLSTLERD